MKTLLTSLMLFQCTLVLCQSDWIFPYKENGLYGYTNSCGDRITEPIFQEAYETYGKLAIVKLKGKYGFISNSGRIIIKPKYIQVNDFFLGRAVVTTKKGKRISINPDGSRYKGGPKELHGGGGHCLYPTVFDKYSMIKLNNKYSFAMKKYVDKHWDGSIIYAMDTLNLKFDTIVGVDPQLMYVSMNGKHAFLFDGWLKYGETTLDSLLKFEFDEIINYPCFIYPEFVYPVSENSKLNSDILAVRIDKLWGFVHIHVSTPKITHTPKYSSIISYDFYRNYALVEYFPGRFGYVSTRYGKEFFCE